MTIVELSEVSIQNARRFVVGCSECAFQCLRRLAITDSSLKCVTQWSSLLVPGVVHLELKFSAGNCARNRGEQQSMEVTLTS